MPELERRVKLAPYGFKDGKPAYANPTQEKILDWVDKIRSAPKDDISQDQIPTLYLSGGAGSGKTRGFLSPVIEMLYQEPGIKILWCRQDYNDLRLSAMQTFEEVMPQEMIVRQSGQEHWFDIANENGKPGRIFFSGAKDASGKGSQEFAVIVITEAYEVNLQTFRILKLRCRQAGQPLMILIEGNPPNETHWLERCTDPKDPDYDPSITKWEVSTRENWLNLPAAYRNSLEMMPMSWKRKYLEGKAGFMPDGDSFYQGFQEERHTADLDWKDEELLIGIDYGYQHPACAVAKIDAAGRFCLLREWIGTNALIRKFAEDCKVKLSIYYPNFKCKVFGDPAGQQNSDKSKEVSQAIVSDVFNVPVISRPSNMTGANYESRKLIIEPKLNTYINGAPSILVDRRCRYIIDGFNGGYHYPKHDPNRPITEKTDVPVRDGFYEHIMNAMEYIMVNIYDPIQVHTKRKIQIPRRKPSQHDNI